MRSVAHIAALHGRYANIQPIAPDGFKWNLVVGVLVFIVILLMAFGFVKLTLAANKRESHDGSGFRIVAERIATYMAIFVGLALIIGGGGWYVAGSINSTVVDTDGTGVSIIGTDATPAATAKP